MKRTLITLLVLHLSLTGFSQTCEQREDKLLSTIGTLSAVYIYNTYTTIGSVCDGNVKNVYTDSLAIIILEEQQSLLDVVMDDLSKLVKDKMLKDANDVSFMNTMNPVLKGLRDQAQAYIDFMKTHDESNTTAYRKLRKSNWKSICGIMSIPYQEED